MLRRWLPVAAAVALLALTPTCPRRSPASRPGFAEAAPAETRALWVLRTSLASPESITALVRTAREHGFNTLLVQVRGRGDAYFTSGLEPRAADLQRRPATFDPLATVLDAGARGRAARARVGQRQPRLERRRPADRADAHRPPPSRVADGAARPRAGTVARPRREPGVRRQARALDACADDRHRDRRPPQRSKASTRRRSCPRPPITSTRSSATSSRATRSTASTSTTRATRPNASTTAAAPFARSATPSGRSSPARCGARSTARKPTIPLPIRTRFPAEWKAFRIARLTALIGRLRDDGEDARVRTRS